MTEHRIGWIDEGEPKRDPNPGPSIFHDFRCTHNPCACDAHTEGDTMNQTIDLIDCVLTRYFNVAILLSGGSGPEAAISRRYLAEEIALVIKANADAEAVQSDPVTRNATVTRNSEPVATLKSSGPVYATERVGRALEDLVESTDGLLKAPDGTVLWTSAELFNHLKSAYLGDDSNTDSNIRIFDLSTYDASHSQAYELGRAQGWNDALRRGHHEDCEIDHDLSSGCARLIQRPPSRSAIPS